MRTIPIEPCPLCTSTRVTLLYRGGKASGYRHFLRCANCGMTFVPRSEQMDTAAQRERYLEHNNHIHDPDYRRFLARLYDPLKPLLKPRSKGLDFGCGPGPALLHMMLEDGHDARGYDIFFMPERDALTQTYDFITCTETAEHLADPAAEFALLNDMLRCGGWLGVMTGMLDDLCDFPEWYYHRDPTHINFFSRTTMRWVGNRFNWQLHLPAPNVALFRKRCAAR